MSDLTLADLVKNNTMSPEIAAILWSVAAEQRSFVVVAIPQAAGKSTTMNAMLQALPSTVPIHHVLGDDRELDTLKQKSTGGYLLVNEFSQAPVPGYIWGKPVRRVFETLRAGYSLATSLHAPSLESAYAAICQGSGVPDEDASRVNYMVYIRRMGDTRADFWRRVAELHEVDRVVNGQPQGRLLARWIPEKDTFEQVAQPRLLKATAATLRQRAEALKSLAANGKTAVADLHAAVV